MRGHLLLKYMPREIGTRRAKSVIPEDIKFHIINIHFYDCSTQQNNKTNKINHSYDGQNFKTGSPKKVV